MKRILLLALISITCHAMAKTKVGVILPTVGPFSSSVCVIKKAAELNPEIELKIHDSGNTILGVIEGSKKFLKEEVDYVIGSRTSQEALSMLEILKDNKRVISVIPMASHPDITRKYGRSVRMIPSSTYYAKKIAELINAEVKSKTLIIVTNLSLPYSEEYTNLVKGEEAIKGFIIRQVKFISGQYVGSLFNTIKSNKEPVAVYLPLYTSEATSIIKQLVESDLNVKVFTHGGTLDGVEQYKLLLSGNKKMSIFINNIWNGIISSKLKKEYLEIASRCQTNPMEFRTIVSYDSLKIIERKIRYKKLPTDFNIDYQGILGNYKFDELRNGVKGFYVLNIDSKGSRIYETP